jgi:Tfp pilus assembly protein PilF
MIMKPGELLLLFVITAGIVSCAGPQPRDTFQMPYDDRIKLASIYIQGGQEDKALAVLEKAVVQDKERPEGWAMLGELYWLKGDLKASSRSLEKALEAGGEDPVILNNLAWIEFERGLEEKALALSDRAVAQDPVPLYPYLETRASILYSLERYGEAAADARAALKMTPEYDREMRGKLEKLIREIEGKSGY